MATATTLKKPAPVSAHPLFPTIVGLWFAALFGLGSLAIRPGLLEQAVLAVQLDTLAPAAAPPLGVTARILLALVMAALGAAIGVRFGRGFAGRHNTPRPQPRQRAVSPGSQDGAPAPVPGAVPGAFPGRRRALAITEIDETYQPHDAAPLPGGGSPYVFDITALSPAPAPLELSTFAEIEPEPEPEQAIERQVFQPGPVRNPAVEAAATEPPHAGPPQASPGPVVANFLPFEEHGRDLSGDPDTLGTVQLAERLAVAMERRRVRRAAACALDAEQPGALAVTAPTAEAPPIPSAPLERFRANEEPASDTAEQRVPRSLPAALRPFAFAEIGEDDDDLDDAVPLASLLPPRRSEIAAMTIAEAAPLDLDEDEAIEDAAAEDDASYSSLLGLGQSALPRQDFVRIEEPAPLTDAIEPVVIFPGQLTRTAPLGASAPAVAASATPVEGFRPFDSPSAAEPGQPVTASAQAVQHDPVETERALRAALSNLQRMSGAA